jgi:3-phenylpropionate/cinnamic acid dioxygenase small subunit
MSTAIENGPVDAASAAPAASVYRSVDPQLQHAVEQFYFAEAELLDDHRYGEWVELFTEEVRYWLPTRMTRTNRERDLEIAGEDGSALIDDNLYYLKGRVRKVTSGLSWSEEPPSRTRRLITNIRVTPGHDGRLAVRCNFSVYRSRLERHEDWFIGERFDVLRPANLEATGYPFAIAERRIVLEQTILLAPSLSIFL